MENKLLNATQHDNAQLYFIQNYGKLEKQATDACQSCNINPYTAGKELIDVLNSSRIEDINDKISELITGNIYASTYMESKKAYYALFRSIKNNIKNQEIIDFVENYFSVEKYETHVGAYIDQIINNK